MPRKPVASACTRKRPSAVTHTHTIAPRAIIAFTPRSLPSATRRVRARPCAASIAAPPRVPTRARPLLHLLRSPPPPLGARSQSAPSSRRSAAAGIARPGVPSVGVWRPLSLCQSDGACCPALAHAARAPRVSDQPRHAAVTTHTTNTTRLLHVHVGGVGRRAAAVLREEEGGALARARDSDDRDEGAPRASARESATATSSTNERARGERDTPPPSVRRTRIEIR